MPATSRERLRASRLRRRLARNRALSVNEAAWLRAYERAHPPRKAQAGTPPPPPPPRDDDDDDPDEGEELDEDEEPEEEPDERAPDVAPPPTVPPLPELPPELRSAKARADALALAVAAQGAALAWMERACIQMERVASLATERMVATEQQLVDALASLADYTTGASEERSPANAGELEDMMKQLIAARFASPPPSNGTPRA